LLYLALGFFIDSLSFPPVAGPENPDLLVSPRKAHSHNDALDPAETEVARLLAAMIEVFSDHAQRAQPAGHPLRIERTYCNLKLFRKIPIYPGRQSRRQGFSFRSRRHWR